MTIPTDGRSYLLATVCDCPSVSIMITQGIRCTRILISQQQSARFLGINTERDCRELQSKQESMFSKPQELMSRDQHF